MAFFNSAIDILQTLVTAIGAGLGAWGVVNLLEGYGNDIGTKKLRQIVDFHPNGDFYLFKGNRLMIKRENFEKFLSEVTAI